MPPRVVIFDMDGVLNTYDVRHRLRLLADLAGISADEVHERVWNSGFEDDADAGAYPSPKQYLEGFALRLGYPLTREDWIDIRRAAITPNMEVLAIAERVKAERDVAMLTNNGPLLQEAFAEVFPEAAGIFAGCAYFSYAFNTKKPDHAVYLRLLEKLGFRPAEAMFVDDKLENALAAGDAGLIGHHFTSAAELQVALKQAGIGIA